MDFKVKVYIPSTKKFEYVREIKNREALTIAKYIQANDDYGLSVSFNEILQDVPGCNIVDKFFVLCQLRALNINNKITINGKHKGGENASYKVNIFAFLGNYLKFTDNIEKEYTFKDNNLEICFSLPKNIYFKNFYSLLNDIVTEIKFNGENLLLGKSNKEKFNIILKFNKRVIDGLKIFINEINKKSDLFFIKSDEDILLPTVKISFFNNTLFNLLKSLYKTDIFYFLNKFYICVTKMGLTYEDYLKLSFVETDILLNIYKSANKIK